MLAAWAAGIVAIASSSIRNPLIFGPFCFLGPPFIFRAPSGILAGISRRAGCALRTRWACHWCSRRGSSTPSHK
jgi:hypothetical protein